jgi:opacity protein-like surface antigen
MKKICTMLFVGCALLASASVQALDWEGFYLEGFGGANWVQTNKRRGVELNFNTGYVIGGSIGYRLCNGLRFEGEVSYRRNTIRSIKVRGETFDFSDSSGSASRSSHSSGSHHAHHDSHHSSSEHGRGRGHLSEVAYMANLIYDLDISYWNSCCSYDITPYFGGGIGYGNQRIRTRHHLLGEDVVAFDDSSGSGSSSEAGHHRRRRNGKNGFAWQIIAGLAYEFSPCFDASVEYRLHQGRAERLYNHMAGLTAKYHF